MNDIQKTVLGLTCTNGRFTYLRRLLTCFLRQDHDKKVLLIYNNAAVPIQMKPIDNVILINNHIDKVTGTPYTDVGSIYRDALDHLPNNIDYITIMDDDDIFLPNHFSISVDFFFNTPSCLVWQ